jgi:hypothetical protein
MRPHGVSAAGQKKGIFGRVRAKTGRQHCAGEHLGAVRSRSLFGIKAAGVSAAERCYEPADTQFVVAIPKPGATVATPLEALITTS